MDSTQGDVMLADGRRHVVIGLIDVYTRRIKLHVARSSSTAGVLSLLRRGLMDWGQPETLVTDNGSDYVSRQMVGVLAGLDIVHDTAPPFTPQYKPHIERAFGTFSHSLLELCGGFIGHNVAERKDIEARKSFAHPPGREPGRRSLRMIADKIRSVELLLAEMACRMTPQDWALLRVARAELRDAAAQAEQLERNLLVPVPSPALPGMVAQELTRVAAPARRGRTLGLVGALGELCNGQA